MTILILQQQIMQELQHIPKHKLERRINGMLNFQLAVKPQTEQRLKKILNQIQDAEIFAQGFIFYQISELQKSNLNIKLDLTAFEKKYNMRSEDFYQKFTQGVVEDSEDFMLWSGLYEMFCQNQSQLNELA